MHTAKDIVSWLNNNQGFVLGLLTMVYVLTTALMAGFMNHANKISRDNEKRRSRPFVVFDMESRRFCMHAVLKNIGQTPARNVVVTSTPKIEGLIRGQKRETTLTTHKIHMLAPSRELSDFVDGNADFYKTNPTPVFNGTIEYDDTSGEHYKEEFSIDLTFQKEHMSLSERDIGQEIEKLRHAIEQSSRRSTPDLVRTITEDQYRKEFEEDHGIQLRPKKES